MADSTLSTDSPVSRSDAAAPQRASRQSPVPEPTPLTGPQCRAARALLLWSQSDLARRAAISDVTVRTFERGHNSIKPSTVRLLRLTFMDAGLDFLDGDDDGRVGVCFARPQR